METQSRIGRALDAVEIRLWIGLFYAVGFCFRVKEFLEKHNL